MAERHLTAKGQFMVLEPVGFCAGTADPTLAACIFLAFERSRVFIWTDRPNKKSADVSVVGMP